MAIMNDQVLKERARSLKQGIAKLSNDPTIIQGANFDPRTAANLASFQNELGDVEGQIGDGQTNQALELFNQYAPSNDMTAEKAAIDEIFGNQQTQQLGALNDIFSKQRSQAIEEAAATGNLRQPAFQASALNNIDAMKSKAIAELFSSLGVGKGQAYMNVANGNKELAFNRGKTAAGIFQGGQQFGDELGFAKDKFNTTAGLSRREQDLNDLFNRDALSEKIRTREDAKPNSMDKILSGIGTATNTASALFGKGKSGGLFGAR